MNKLKSILVTTDSIIHELDIKPSIIVSTNDVLTIGYSNDNTTVTLTIEELKLQEHVNLLMFIEFVDLIKNQPVLNTRITLGKTSEGKLKYSNLKQCIEHIFKQYNENYIGEIDKEIMVKIINILQLIITAFNNKFTLPIDGLTIA